MKRITLLACAVWTCAALCLPIAATAVEDPAGLEQLRKGAEGGDGEAMLELGILYEFGYRMQDHNAPALAWYRMATDAGNAKANARHEALRAKAAAKDLDEANKLYAEYTLTVKKSGPGVPVTPAAMPGTLLTPAGEPVKDTSAPASVDR